MRFLLLILPLAFALPLPEYKTGRILGHGGFGNVYAAVNTADNKDYALKCLLPKRKDESFDAEFKYQRAASGHPNIVNALELVVMPSGETCMAMELANGGSLRDRMAFPNRRWSEERAKPVFKAVLEGLAHLHSKGIAQRDIKPENILFSNEVPKIADFGLSCFVDSRDTEERHNKRGGTQGYKAPELSASSKITDPRPVDIYALGVSLRMILTGDDNSNFHSSTFKELTSDARDLIDKMMEEKASKRITAADALKHPWIAGAKPKPAKVDDSKKPFKAHKHPHLYKLKHFLFGN